jgi:hypothetical protein
MLESFSAIATTREIAPGSEIVGDDGVVRIKDRIFTDLVESSDPRIAGVNRPHLEIDLNPKTGSGRLAGHFELNVSAGGVWRGELSGGFEGGMVRATGLATGSGALVGHVIHVTFRQIEKHPGQPPCPEPKAFFEMQGHILTPE